MKKKLISLILLTTLTLLLLVSCGANQEAQEQVRIQAAVAATLARLPSQTPYPTQQLILQPTPLPLDGLFCEYGFCIGHPSDLYLVDASILRNAATPSTRAYGILFAYNPSLFMQLTWTISGPSYDYSASQRIILEETDQLTGSMDVMLYRNLNVYYQPIGPTASDILPYGAVAVWQCGGRDFSWKVYATQDGIAPGMLQQSLERFYCE
ncbi:MAG: hypothetical protein RBS68_03180 [Anaerolineales bacterium]|jgi:hypothetical protein|nr:hypothetical protein [Anaerolineales bacterium]